ncbi:pyrroline-5-carboxylate reductase 3-like isoform X1 [Xenopus laevis]|uniref:Pyrroline-5-carboxylate reductase 3-like isoform X1 n=1 Tax=Xenopus laevis TaxID=8355 RepID=A0A8J1L5G3_XENLA|nr:pyrroline-5-carboxylate reductase 3-like isoform X1 [Xenopus laevis]
MPPNVMVSAPTDGNLEKFKARGCCTSHYNLSVISNCQVVFLATKPHIIPSVLKEIYPQVTAEHLIISMAAGVTLETLEKVLNLTIDYTSCVNK